MLKRTSKNPRYALPLGISIYPFSLEGEGRDEGDINS
jgi:hypothetical protein